MQTDGETATLSSTAPVSVDSAMRRALELAARGPAGGPNPQVGAVLLSPDGRVLAEGWHRGAGTPHAEAAALDALPAGAAQGATAVVTLEPCNHTGRTGPCAKALIDAGVDRVVYAIADPNPVAGGGAARLAAAGVLVERGLRADESELLNEHWLASVRRGRPWVTVKWASSLDGRAAAADGTSQWITGAAARLDVHRRRAAHGAIVVGIGTVIADDPALTARDGDGALLPHQPVPVVVGRRPIPADAALAAHPHRAITVEAHTPAAALEAAAATGATGVFVEGGPTVVSAMLAAGLADEVLVYLAPTLLGGPGLALTDIGVPTIADRLRMTIRAVERLGDDLLVVARPLTKED